MRARPALAQYEATIVLVAISLSLASVVYSGLERESALNVQPVFVNYETRVGGVSPIELVQVNASSRITVTSIEIGGATSSAGILASDGSSYSVSSSLCAADETTFFAVFASQNGTIDVATDGRAWVSGVWSTAEEVDAGWHEVMIQHGTFCSITLPGGAVAPTTWTGHSATAEILSSIPMQGALSGTAFSFYLPVDEGSSALLVTSSGGMDDVALS